MSHLHFRIDKPSSFSTVSYASPNLPQQLHVTRQKFQLFLLKLISSVNFCRKLSKALVKRGISKDVKENLPINNEFASQGRTVVIGLPPVPCRAYRRTCSRRSLVDTKLISTGELFFQSKISHSNQNKLRSSKINCPLYDDYARRYTYSVRHLLALSLQPV